jgi:hypothetical protein
MEESLRILLLVAFLFAVAAPAQERILGLVEVPAVPAYGSVPAGELGVTLRAGPSVSSEAVAELRSFENIEFREHGYEERSAVVYRIESIDNVAWYQVRLAASGRAAWLSAESAGTFHAAVDLVNDSLAYLTPSWNKKLRLNFEKAETEFLVPLDEQEYSASIAGTVSVNGEPWFLVVVTDGICGTGEWAVLSAGWVPLYAADDSLNLWFYSRGC